MSLELEHSWKKRWEKALPLLAYRFQCDVCVHDFVVFVGLVLFLPVYVHIYIDVCSSVLIWGWGRMVVGMCLFGAGTDIEMMSLGPKPLEIVFSDRHFRHQYCFHFGIKLLGACCASDHMYECVWILISFDVLFCCFVSFGFAAVLPSSCTSI